MLLMKEQLPQAAKGSYTAKKGITNFGINVTSKFVIIASIKGHDNDYFGRKDDLAAIWVV